MIGATSGFNIEISSLNNQRFDIVVEVFPLKDAWRRTLMLLLLAVVHHMKLFASISVIEQSDWNPIDMNIMRVRNGVNNHKLFMYSILFSTNIPTVTSMTYHDLRWEAWQRLTWPLRYSQWPCLPAYVQLLRASHPVGWQRGDKQYDPSSHRSLLDGGNTLSNFLLPQ